MAEHHFRRCVTKGRLPPCPSPPSTPLPPLLLHTLKQTTITLDQARPETDGSLRVRDPQAPSLHFNCLLEWISERCRSPSRAALRIIPTTRQYNCLLAAPQFPTAAAATTATACDDAGFQGNGGYRGHDMVGSGGFWRALYFPLRQERSRTSSLDVNSPLQRRHLQHFAATAGYCSYLWCAMHSASLTCISKQNLRLIFM